MPHGGAFANPFGPIAHGNGEPKNPQAGQTLNNNRVALSTTYTRSGVYRTVGAIDLEANGFFSEIPPERVDEAGYPVVITQNAAALPHRAISEISVFLALVLSIEFSLPKN